MPEIGNITTDERNEFQKMHGSDKRWTTLFSGEVKEGEIRKVIEEIKEKMDNNLEENNEYIFNKDKIKH
jgi:hypothetical protein